MNARLGENPTKWLKWMKAVQDIGVSITAKEFKTEWLVYLNCPRRKLRRKIFKFAAKFGENVEQK